MLSALSENDPKNTSFKGIPADGDELRVPQVGENLWYAMESVQNRTDLKLKFISILTPAWPSFYYDYDSLHLGITVLIEYWDPKQCKKIGKLDYQVISLNSWMDFMMAEEYWKMIYLKIDSTIYWSCF